MRYGEVAGWLDHGVVREPRAKRSYTTGENAVGVDCSLKSVFHSVDLALVELFVRAYDYTM